MTAAMAPAWVASARSVQHRLGPREGPILGLGAAFCFTVMMLNFPLPGGTTAHPLGAVLLAVMLGPQAAVIGMTVALSVQALFFGDGGILALGANSFAMALVMPVCGYWVFRALRRKQGAPGRLAWAAGAAGYAGVVAASLVVALVLGAQPLLFREEGRALYFPFGPAVTLSAIVLPHLLIVGFAEAAVTATAVAFLMKAGFRPFGEDSADARSARWSLAWLGMGAVLALAPLGLLANGEAWGEWSPDTLAQRAGFLPEGLARSEAAGWKGFLLLPDYLGERGWPFYVFSGLAGILLCLAAGLLIARRRGTTVAESPPEETYSPPSDGELPDWLANARQVDAAPSRQSGTPGSRGSDFLEKSLLEIAERSRDALYLESTARLPGLLQGMNSALKALCAIGLILCSSLAGSTWVLGGLFAVTFGAAVASKLPARSFLARSFAPALFFGACVALPGATNLAHPGADAIVLLGSPRVSLTEPGLQFALITLLRLLAIASIGSLLAMTTRWADLIAALRRLRAPAAFVTTMALTYRYLSVLARAASEVLLARKSRIAGSPRAKGSRRFVGELAGMLMARSLHLSAEVEEAIAARGGARTEAARAS